MKPIALAAVLTALLAQPALADECTDELAEVLRTSVTSGPFRHEARVAEADGSTRSIIGEDVPPDAVRRGNGQDSGFIIIGDKGWTLVDGEWQESDPEVVDLLRKVMFVDIEDTIAAMTKVSCAEAFEADDGRMIKGYDYTVENGGAVSTVSLFIDVATGLPDLESKDYLSKEGELSNTITIYVYDDTITIEPPL